MGLSAPAKAAPVTFLFGGQVTGSEISAAANVGDILSGSLTFDSSAIDFHPADPGRAAYFPAVTNLTVDTGSYVGAGSSGSVSINDNFSVSPFDRFQARATAISESVGVFTPVTFVVELFDTTASMFSSDALPLTPPSLIDLTYATVSMQFFDNIRSTFASITAQLDTLTAANGSSVPAPAASALLIVGLALVGLRRKR